MKIVQIAKEKILIPADYNELSVEAYQYALELIVRGKSKYDFLFLLFMKVTGMKFRFHTGTSLEVTLPSGSNYFVDKSDFYYAVSSLDWMLEERGGAISLKTANALQLMPKIDINGKVFYGPTTGLSNVIWGEFIMLKTYYTRYLNTKDRNWLYMLMAVLYREYNGMKIEDPNFKGDFRIPYNSARDEHMSQFWKENATDVQIMAVCHYVIGGLVFLQYAYPQTFAAKELSDDKGEEIPDPFKSLFELTDNLGEDASKTEDLLNTQAHFVCQRLENLIKAEKKLKKQLKSTN